MSSHRFELIGIGNPIMDLLAHVDDSFLSHHVAGDKGGMVLVDESDIAGLVTRLGGNYAMTPGGSAANAVLGATKLGLTTTFLGKIGGDGTAAVYRANFTAAGGDGSRFKHATLPNGRCLSLVTPDGQRTMRTHLGAAMTLSPDEIGAGDFAGAKHAHIEGYLLFNPALAEKVAATARAAGCTISLELSSFEVVNVARDWILAQLEQGVDIVFANEDEARSLFREDTPYEDYARRIAGCGGIACVKIGKDGAWVAHGKELNRIAPVKVSRVVDTTGAGDAWAGGFLYGWLRGLSLAGAGALGAALGAECVQHLGPAIPEVHWPRLRNLSRSLKWVDTSSRRRRRLAGSLHPGECLIAAPTMKATGPILFCLVVTATVAEEPAAPGMISDRLKAEVRANLPAYTPPAPQPRETPAAPAATDPDVLELPKFTVREKQPPKIEANDLLTPQALNKKYARDYKNSLTGLDAFLNGFSLPLVGPSLAARGRALHRARQYRDMFSTIEAIRTVDPGRAATLHAEMVNLLANRPPGSK